MFDRQRWTAAAALGAVSLGLVLMPSVASADTSVSPECDAARAAYTAASQQVTSDQHALRALLHANGHNRGNRAAIKAARATLRADRAARHHARLAEVEACAPGQTVNANLATLTQMGTLLHAMGNAAATSGSLPTAFDPSQVVTYLNSLFPGISSALSESQLEALVQGFQAPVPADLTQLQGLVSSIPGLASVDLTQLADPATLATLVQSIATELTTLLGTPVTPTTDPATAIQTLLTSLLGSLQGVLGSL